MRKWFRSAVVGLLIGLPAIALAQTSTDRTELDTFLKDTQNQGDLPVGTKITMQNWEQYKAFMPFGMTVLFEGKYYWKMPADVEIDVGPVHNGILPKTFLDATEKYSAQNSVEALPNGHYRVNNFHGGVPFPNPQEPNKGYKELANVFFAYVPAIITSTPDNMGAIWFDDRSATFQKTPSTWCIGRARTIQILESPQRKLTLLAPGTPNGSCRKLRSRHAIPPRSKSSTKTWKRTRFLISSFSCPRFGAHCVYRLQHDARRPSAATGQQTMRS
jgi:hypothetical protein